MARQRRYPIPTAGLGRRPPWVDAALVRPRQNQAGKVSAGIAGPEVRAARDRILALGIAAANGGQRRGAGLHLSGTAIDRRRRTCLLLILPLVLAALLPLRREGTRQTRGQAGRTQRDERAAT